MWLRDEWQNIYHKLYDIIMYKTIETIIQYSNTYIPIRFFKNRIHKKITNYQKKIMRFKI